MQFPKPRIAIKEPTDRITIKHESWRLSGRPARLAGAGNFSVFFLSFFLFLSRFMGFMNPCLETNILPTWQERGEKKIHLEHRAAFGCTRPWAVTEFVWIPLIHARLAKPSGQETWKSRGAEGAGGRKDGIHQGGKKGQREEETMCCRKTAPPRFF